MSIGSILTNSDDLYMWHQNWHQYLWTSLGQFMNFLQTSSIVQVLDFLAFDFFLQFDTDLLLSPTQPIVRLFLTFDILSHYHIFLTYWHILKYFSLFDTKFITLSIYTCQGDFNIWSWRIKHLFMTWRVNDRGWMSFMIFRRHIRLSK